MSDILKEIPCKRYVDAIKHGVRAKEESKLTVATCFGGTKTGRVIELHIGYEGAQLNKEQAVDLIYEIYKWLQTV